MGTPLPVTQAVVGHMSAQMTRHYTHISESAARKMAERMDEFRKQNRFEPVFVDDLVDDQEGTQKSGANSVN